MKDQILKNANILIVDDKEANIDILEGFLGMQGYRNVKSTTDPRLVVDLFKSFSPDLILLDLMMPQINGFEVMRQLKEYISESNYLPILVLTADTAVETKQRALAGGAKDFLSKPFDLVEVGLRIGNLLFARYLHIQMQNQNQLLEEKVRARTTELEKSNADLIVAKDKAEAGDRLKTEFIRNISHEIRTPLNGILGMYQVLTDPDGSQQGKEDYYAHLKSSSDRLIKTVTDYMDIALLVSGNMEVEESEFEPSGLLDEIFQHYLAICIGKNLKFDLAPPQQADNFRIKSDRNLLRKAMSHLMDNAVKYTGQGTVSIGVVRKGECLEFYVKDTGVGIDEATQEFVFKPFAQEDTTTTRFVEGSGLGLTIAQKMVELIGGHIRVQSARGLGSTFFVSIPCP